MFCFPFCRACHSSQNFWQMLGLLMRRWEARGQATNTTLPPDVPRFGDHTILPEALQDPKHSGSLFTVKCRRRAPLPLPQLPLSILSVQFRL